MNTLETEWKSDDNTPKVYMTRRPLGTTTYFTGAGDDPVLGLGQGDKVLFKMAASDPQRTIFLQFNEDIYVKDGYMISEGAPFGACIDMEIIHPSGLVLATFAKQVPVYGSGWFPLDSEDRGKVLAGLQIKITLYNSTGIGVEDPPADFKVAGRLEIFRSTTTGMGTPPPA